MYHFYRLVCGSSQILHPWAEDLPVQDLHSNLALGYSKKYFEHLILIHLKRLVFLKVQCTR